MLSLHTRRFHRLKRKTRMYFTIVSIMQRTERNIAPTLRAINATVTDRSFESILVQNNAVADQKAFKGLRFDSKILSTDDAALPGIMLNAALTHATGDIVVFLPAGAAPEPQWLEGLAGTFDRLEVAAVVPRIVDTTGLRMRAAGARLEDGKIIGNHADAPRDVTWALMPALVDLAPLCGFALRRSVLPDVLGFDVDFGQALYDFDLTLRLRMKQHKIAYRPDVTIRYDGPLFRASEPECESAAQRFVERWSTVFTPNLILESFRA
jgi:hypothetical protein